VEFELVEIDPEGALEACHRSRQHHRAVRCIGLHDGEIVPLGEFLDRCQVDQRSSELPGEVGTTEEGLGRVAGGELRDLRLEASAFWRRSSTVASRRSAGFALPARRAPARGSLTLPARTWMLMAILRFGG
jgi:hypothetical protein